MPSWPSQVRPGRVETASGFGPALSRADSRGCSQEQPGDEAEAQRELAQLLAQMKVGHQLSTLLAPKAGFQPGPHRRVVEGLKSFLRKWTGWPPDPGEGDGPSLNVLFYSLPLEYRNLLFQVYPDLRTTLQVEQARLLHRRFV